MSNDNLEIKGINRRDFIKGSAISAVGLASVSLLSGCGQDAVSPTPSSDQNPAASYETAPAPIPEKSIKRTISADVVVVGGGTGGMFAALAAAEAGARTVLLEKASVAATGPAWMAALNSSLQKKMGVKIDRDEAVEEICRYGGHLVDQRLINLWADKSGEAMDWFMPIVSAAGLQTVVETDVKEGFYKNFPVAHVVVAPNEKVDTFPTGGIGSSYYIPVLVKRAKELGVNILYETPLQQLVKDKKGRVTAAIAKNAQNEYIRINASKGIVLCTGGYARNTDMLKELCPNALETGLNVAPLGNTGDGIKAALWVGAAMDPDHVPMVFDRALVMDEKKMGPPWKGGYLHLGSQPFLRVNLKGERFVNEDLPYDYAWNAALMEPGKVWWEIWDNNWTEDIKKFHSTVCARIINTPGAPPRAGIETVEKDLQMYLKMGMVKKADSLEELARQMGIPANTFLANAERYNQMYKQGKDSDFGKLPSRLSALEKAPFYAAKLGGLLICSLGGLRINTQMQVLDKDCNAIPGLYAAGNDSGSFFAQGYPELLGGLALGRTATFGRIAGQIAASAS